jgi:hypothetical protein
MGFFDKGRDTAYVKTLAKHMAELTLLYFNLKKERNPDAAHEDLYIRTITDTPGSPYDRDDAISMVTAARQNLGSDDSGESRLWKVVFHLTMRDYLTKAGEVSLAEQKAILDAVRTIIPEDL